MSETPKIIKWNGKPVTVPGIYSGIPIEHYHSQEVCDGPSISSTGQRLLWRKSPKHFYASWSGNPDADDDEETKEKALGSAVHHLFLSEDGFSTRYIQRPDALKDDDGDMTEWNSNKAICKKWLKEQRTARRTVLLKSQIKSIRGMAKSVKAEVKDDPLIGDLLFGEVECSMLARCPDTGVWLKSRPDVIPATAGHFADLKTTGTSVCDLDLKLTLKKWQYHMQAGLVWRCAELLNIPFTSFALVYVETKNPYCVRVIEMPDGDLSRGRLQGEAMTRLFARCLRSKRWPGPGKSSAEFFGLSIDESGWIDKRLNEIAVEENAIIAAEASRRQRQAR